MLGAIRAYGPLTRAGRFGAGYKSKCEISLDGQTVDVYFVRSAVSGIMASGIAPQVPTIFPLRPGAILTTMTP